MAPGAAEGLVVFAERQTAGRGQYGRRWESAAGKGLWMSVLLRPGITSPRSSRLTDLLAQTSPPPSGRNRGMRVPDQATERCLHRQGKIAGVLVEMRVEMASGYMPPLRAWAST